MDINCIICSDLFTQQSDIVLNQCGHVFHNACLRQWLERSKTCPACRTRATEKSMTKVYFNFLNADHITDNIVTLQAKLDNTNFKFQLLQKNIKDLTEDNDTKKMQIIGLRELISETEHKNRSLESVIINLKEKVDFYKKKTSETEMLRNEIATLKLEVQTNEKVRTAIYGTRAEVTEILRNERSIEALALLSATLKKTLIDMERKANMVQHRLKDAQYQISKYKKECSCLESTNAELKKDLCDGKKVWEEEKQYLKQKILELNNTLNQKKENLKGEMDDSVHRILTESPAPLPRRRTELKCINGIKSSPSVAENVADIMDSDSPYLKLKANYSSLFPAKFSAKHGETKSLLKSRQLPEPKQSVSSTLYNGLGGQVTEDYCRFPEKKAAGLKRQKSSSCVPSSKFKKLAPTPSTKKITDFVSFD